MRRTRRWKILLQPGNVHMKVGLAWLCDSLQTTDSACSFPSWRPLERVWVTEPKFACWWRLLPRICAWLVSPAGLIDGYESLPVSDNLVAAQSSYLTWALCTDVGGWSEPGPSLGISNLIIEVSSWVFIVFIVRIWVEIWCKVFELLCCWLWDMKIIRFNSLERRN